MEYGLGYYIASVEYFRKRGGGISGASPSCSRTCYFANPTHPQPQLLRQ